MMNMDGINQHRFYIFYFFDISHLQLELKEIILSIISWLYLLCKKVPELSIYINTASEKADINYFTVITTTPTSPKAMHEKSSKNARELLDRPRIDKYRKPETGKLILGDFIKQYLPQWEAILVQSSLDTGGPRINPHACLTIFVPR